MKNHKWKDIAIKLNYLFIEHVMLFVLDCTTEFLYNLTITLNIHCVTLRPKIHKKYLLPIPKILLLIILTEDLCLNFTFFGYGDCFHSIDLLF